MIPTLELLSNSCTYLSYEWRKSAKNMVIIERGFYRTSLVGRHDYNVSPVDQRYSRHTRPAQVQETTEGEKQRGRHVDPFGDETKLTDNSARQNGGATEAARRRGAARSPTSPAMRIGRRSIGAMERSWRAVRLSAGVVFGSLRENFSHRTCTID